MRWKQAKAAAIQSRWTIGSITSKTANFTKRRKTFLATITEIRSLTRCQLCPPPRGTGYLTLPMLLSGRPIREKARHHRQDTGSDGGTGIELTQTLSVRRAVFDRQLRFLPCFPTTGNIPKFFEAGWFQNAGRNARTISAAAINGRRLVAIELAHSLFQFRNENVTRAGNVSFFPFARSANIDNLKRCFFLV